MASLSSLIIMSMLCSAWAAQDFQSVSACPRDGVNWNSESVKKNCQGDTPDYLCAAIENQPKKYGQICTKYGLTPAHKCAVLNEQTYNLDSVDCKAASGCPTNPYIPSELWKYQICYGDFYGTTTVAAAGTTQKTINETTGSASRSRDSGSGAGLKAEVVVPVILLIILIIVIVVGILVAYRKNLCGFKGKVNKRIPVTDIRTHFPCFQCFQQSNDTEGHQDVEKGQPSQEQAQPLMQQDIRTHFPCFQCFQQSNDTEGHQGQPSQEQAQPLMQQDVEKGQPSQEHALIQQEPMYAKPDKDKTKKDSKPAKSKSTSDSNGEVQTQDKDKDDTKQKIKKLNGLQKYLVHILKQELCVNDLKEKAVIHSKSMHEHFTEPIINGLQSIKDHNDYGQLDMSLVFALLRNFCDGIKPPSRGWDYEPPDDETHVGADIERIRSMWNKYCDNDLQFKHLDDVYNRMKQKYGTVAVHGDDGVRKSLSKAEDTAEHFESMKDKIQSIKLNPDCIVENGIVITENITTTLKILKSRNVVILKGVIGCGKTHALKAIQNHFQGNNWETAWVESERFQDKISHEKQTILLCDNFFGRYGSNVFSQDVVNKTEKVLKEIEGFKLSKTKVVIGMHTHVYDEVKKNLNLNFLHQKNITVEMDNLSEAETLLIFKEQLKWGHCEKDPSCWFKTVGFQSVLGKITKNQGHIGGPFLSLMYCNQHELFSDETFSVNPIQTLKQHFQRMGQDSATLYTCLLYLMCVQEHNCDKDPETWAGLISADITNLKLKDVATTSSYVQMKTNEETLVHEILTIVLFKSAAETSVEIFKPVVERCKLGFMLQILRPVSTHNNDLYCGFMNVDKKSDFREIGDIFVCRCVIEKTLDIKHPLRTLDFVQKMFKKWQSKPPKGLVEKITM